MRGVPVQVRAAIDAARRWAELRDARAYSFAAVRVADASGWYEVDMSTFFGPRRLLVQTAGAAARVKTEIPMDREEDRDA